MNIWTGQAKDHSNIAVKSSKNTETSIWINAKNISKIVQKSAQLIQLLLIFFNNYCINADILYSL